MEIELEHFSILWRGFYLEGHEVCRLIAQGSQWHLAGSAVFAYQNRPCRLDYYLVCDSGWHTLSGQVNGWLGNSLVEVDLMVEAGHRWRLNGEEQPGVEGCIDLDLNFSPSTNLLPIRRLNMNIGQEETITAAWLRFPNFELEPLPQRYRRLDHSTYRYESAGGEFVADLQVDPTGFVLDYPGIWKAEATSWKSNV
jgi:uncharacterized protein